MRVYDLMLILAKLPPYADIGAAWDGAIADIDAVGIDKSGTVILDAGSFASLDIRQDKVMPS